MSNDPSSLDTQMESGRSLVYRLMYLGLPIAVLYLFGLAFEWSDQIVRPLGGAMAGLLLSTATADADEFFAAELSFAARTTVCAIGLLTFSGLSSQLLDSPLYEAPVVFGLLSCVFFLALLAKRARGWGQ